MDIKSGFHWTPKLQIIITTGTGRHHLPKNIKLISNNHKISEKLNPPARPAKISFSFPLNPGAETMPLPSRPRPSPPPSRKFSPTRPQEAVTARAQVVKDFVGRAGVGCDERPKTNIDSRRAGSTRRHGRLRPARSSKQRVAGDKTSLCSGVDGTPRVHWVATGVTTTGRESVGRGRVTITDWGGGGP